MDTETWSGPRGFTGDVDAGRGCRVEPKPERVKGHWCWEGVARTSGPGESQGGKVLARGYEGICRKNAEQTKRPWSVEGKETGCAWEHGHRNLE